MADFWGIEKIFPQISDDRGYSMMLIHSDKGMALWDKVKDQTINYRTNTEIVNTVNACAVNSVEKNSKRTEFFQSCSNKAVRSCMKKYVNEGILFKIKTLMKKCIKIILKW